MSSFSIFRNRKKILPMIYQNEAAECGLACLAMMAGYYCYHVSMVSLRRKFIVSPRGMTFKDIIEHARSLNLDTRAIKISIEVIDHVGLPCIVHWDLNHFVVLSHVTKNKVTIHDPNIGKRVLTRKEFARHFTGLILEVVPSKEFKKHEELQKLRINDLWGKLVGLKRGLTQLVILSFFLQFVVLVNPVFLQLVVDDVLMNLNYDLLVILAIGFATLAILHGVASLVREFLIIYLGAALGYQMVSNLFSHLMKLPVSYFENRHLGDITSRFGSTDAIRKLVTEGIVGAVIDGIMGVTTLTIMCIYSPFLCFISMLFWGVYFAARRISFFFYRELSEGELIASAKERSYFIETVRALPMLKLYSGGKNRHTFWRNLSLASIGASADVRRAKSFYESFSVVVTGVELVAVTFFAAKMVLDTRFTVGMLLAYLAYRTTFVSKTITFIERIMEFKMLSLHLERISDIVYTAVEKHDDQIKTSDFPITGSVELKKIFYKYSENSPHVINDLSIHIKAGETIAIVGRTGCGKSTLFKILTSLFSPIEGCFLIDGIPLENIGLENYRKQIGVVAQDNVLVSGTLLDNITMLDTHVDELDLYSACSIAGILDDILAMPMQFDTLIGDLGSTLSGGQKQRIAIARALYRKPKILFMDEGTSHLDIGMEKIITDGISRLNITCVLIAHRPETIRCANRVFEFSDGKVVEVKGAEIQAGESMIDLRMSDFKAVSAREVSC